jgi:NAD-dependent dihydropyrimidine dehydrogenase PreA subunit
MDDVSLFRYPPALRRVAFAPKLDWSAWNVERDPLTARETPPGTGGDSTDGLGMAVEMCNNNGHCRKFDTGTMCPSYRVTRDEQHTTRGRANTLRLALSGQLGSEDLAGDAVHAALDLCVSCKGCKRECPTGVDMAKLKIEALAARAERSGIGLHDRLIAYLPRYAPAVSRLPWLPALRDRIPGAARAAEHWLGISAQRALPRWQGDYLRLRTPPATANAASNKEVLLFVDTFTNYFAHENARGEQRPRVRRLRRARQRRSKIVLYAADGRFSAGLVDEAKAEARRTSMRCCRWCRVVSRSSAWSPHVCSVCATNFSTTVSGGRAIAGGKRNDVRGVPGTGKKPRAG